MHANMQVFLAASARFADSIVSKNKSFFGKDTTRKKTAFLDTLFVENERETSGCSTQPFN